MHILLIEDDLDLGRALHRALTANDFSCEWLRRISDVPHSFIDTTYDCVLLDLSLPDGTGLDLLARWRNQNIGLPVIVITARSTLEDRLAHVTTSMSLSIIGCVVNGPGEALMTDIGFTGGGAGAGMVYLAGKQDHKLSNDKMIEHIVELVETKAAELARNSAASATFLPSAALAASTLKSLDRGFCLEK